MKKLFGILAGILIVVALGGAATGVAWAMYVNHSEGPVVRSVAGALPIPAGKVGEHTILYRDYLDAVDTMRVFLASDAAKEQGIDLTVDEELLENVYERLLNEAALEDVANEQGVTVTDAELLTFFSEVHAVASSTTSDIGTYLLETYGWNEEEFREKILRPALLEQKFAVQLSESGGTGDEIVTYVAARMARDDVKRYMRF